MGFVCLCVCLCVCVVLRKVLGGEDKDLFWGKLLMFCAKTERGVNKVP